MNTIVSYVTQFIIQVVALVIFSKDIRASRCSRVRITLRGAFPDEHIKNHELTHGWHELLVKGRYEMLFVQVTLSPEKKNSLMGECVEHLYTISTACMSDANTRCA